jgi:hypothetical protein
MTFLRSNLHHAPGRYLAGPPIHPLRRRAGAFRSLRITRHCARFGDPMNCQARQAHKIELAQELITFDHLIISGSGLSAQIYYPDSNSRTC